jgi:hypothetical protein
MEERKNICGFKDLIVRQRSLALAVEIYQITKEFPRDETYGLLNRAQPDRLTH